MSQKVDLQVLAGDYVKTALIAEWKVNVGDTVKKDDVLLACETAKVTVDIPSPCDGVVEQILFPAGEEVDITDTVAVIGDGSGAAAAPAPAAAETAAPTAAAPAAAAATGARIFVTPVAKKIAKELGIDIEAMKAALGQAKISKKDVYAYAETLKNAPKAAAPAPAAAPAVKETPVKGRRRAIAQKMSESASTKPRVTLMLDADLEELLRAKKYLGEKYPDRRITVTGLLAVAVCKTLKSHPIMNATYENDVIREHADIRLGIAADMEEGLIVPVIGGCAEKTGLEICQAVNETVKGCRENTLPPSAYAGGTFTISNLGSAGIKYFTPIINTPELAILGVGSMRKELALENGQVVERRKIGLCLSFDHRAVDGAPAGSFLKDLKENIENPFLLGF